MRPKLQRGEDDVRVFARQIADEKELRGNFSPSVPADVQNDFDSAVGAVYQAAAAANAGRGISISLAFREAELDSKPAIGFRAGFNGRGYRSLA